MNDREKMEPILVLARSFRDFVRWCRDEGIDPNRGPYRCLVSRASPVLSYSRGTKVIALGGWAENSLYTREMLSMLMARYDLSGVENLP